MRRRSRPRAAIHAGIPALLLACVLGVSTVACSAQPGASPGPAAPATSLTPDQWRADLAFLARTLPAKHPEPFGRITRERWLAAVAELDGRVPSLRTHEVLVGFMRLVAMIGDAHTVASAANFPPGFRALPIRLFWFADGLHVAAVVKGQESMLGLRLTRVGSTPVDSAVQIVSRTFVDENLALHRTGSAQALVSVEVLHACGLVDDPSNAALTLEGPKGATEVTLTPIADVQAATWVRWPEAAGAPTPLARSHPQTWYWRERDASGLLFIQYNRCADSPELTVADFIRQTLAEVDARPPRGVVVDLRYNSGGSSSLLEPLIRGLAQRSPLNAPDRLFVLIGRQTFSSALMNAVQFRQSTRATLIGEPTGGRPNHFGELKTFTLPHSGLVIQHSTRYFRQQEKDEDALYPDVRVDVRAADYGAGRDPLMEEALRRCRPATP